MAQTSSLLLRFVVFFLTISLQNTARAEASDFVGVWLYDQPEVNAHGCTFERAYGIVIAFIDEAGELNVRGTGGGDPGVYTVAGNTAAYESVLKGETWSGNPNQAVVAEIDALRPTYVFELALSEDGSVGYGIAHSYCASWNGSDEITMWEEAEIPGTMRRLEYSMEFVQNSALSTLGGVAWDAVEALRFDDDVRLQTMLQGMDAGEWSKFSHPADIGYIKVGAPEAPGGGLDLASTHLGNGRFLSDPVVFSEFLGTPSFETTGPIYVGKAPNGTVIEAELHGLSSTAQLKSDACRDEFVVSVVDSNTGELVSRPVRIDQEAGIPAADRIVANLRAPDAVQTSGAQYELVFRGLPEGREITGDIVPSIASVVRINGSLRANSPVDGVIRIPIQSVSPGSTTLSIGLVCGQSGSRVLRRVVDINVRTFDIGISGTPNGLEEHPGALLEVQRVYEVSLRTTGQYGTSAVNAAELVVQAGAAQVEFFADAALVQPFPTEYRSPDSYRVAVWNGSSGRDVIPNTVWMKISRRSQYAKDIRLSFGRLGWGEEDNAYGDEINVTAFEIEIGSPGVQERGPSRNPIIIGLNDDSDNGDAHTKDHLLALLTYSGEDDLEPIEISVKPTIPDGLGLWIDVPYGIRVWADADKDPDLVVAPDPGAWELELNGNGTQKLYLEGVEDGPNQNLNVVVAEPERGFSPGSEPRPASAPNLASTQILHVVKADITALGDPDPGTLEVEPGIDIADHVEESEPEQITFTLAATALEDVEIEINVAEPTAVVYADDDTTPLTFPVSYSIADLPEKLRLDISSVSDMPQVNFKATYLLKTGDQQLEEVHSDLLKVSGLTSTERELVLDPWLIIAPYDVLANPHTEELSLYYLNNDGEPFFLQKNANIDWAFIGADDIPDFLQESYDSLLAKLNEKIPAIDVADISVGEAGELTVSSPGINILAARFGDEWSNAAVIIAGLKAEKLTLAPGFISHPAILALRYLGNKRLTMLSDKGSWNPLEFDYGTIDFVDVELNFVADVDGPRIKLTELIDVIQGVAEDTAAGIGRVAGLLVGGPQGAVAGGRIGAATGYLLVGALDGGLEAWLEANLELKSANTDVAWIFDASEVHPFSDELKNWLGVDPARIINHVQAENPGTTEITGDLDLQTLGKVTDQVSTLVLPRIDELQIFSQEELGRADRPNPDDVPIVIGDPPVLPAEAQLVAVAQMYLSDQLKSELSAREIEELRNIGFELREGGFELPFEIEGHRVIVRGEVVFIDTTQTPEFAEVTMEEINIEFEIHGVDPEIPGLGSTQWTFEANSFNGCQPNIRMQVTNGVVECETVAEKTFFGFAASMYDYVVSAIQGSGIATIPVTAEFEHTGLGSATGNRNVRIEASVCRVGGATFTPEISETVESAATSITTLDQRFEGYPYRDLMTKVVENYQLRSFSSPPSLTQAIDEFMPGSFGPTRVAPSSDSQDTTLEAGWAHFVEIPVASSAACDLYVGASWNEQYERSPESNDFLETEGSEDPVANGYRFYTAARYASTDSEFKEALIYVRAPNVRLSEGEDWRVFRLSERISVIDRVRRSPGATDAQVPMPVFVVQQGSELVLRNRSDGPTVSVRRYNHASGSPGFEWSGPPAPTIGEIFSGVPRPPELDD